MPVYCIVYTVLEAVSLPNGKEAVSSPEREEEDRGVKGGGAGIVILGGGRV